jgi:hypothetical protein
MTLWCLFYLFNGQKIKRANFFGYDSAAPCTNHLTRMKLEQVGPLGKLRIAVMTTSLSEVFIQVYH